MAALAFNVSKMVSMSKTSTPPSTKPFICSVYAATTSSKVTARKPGLFTSGESDNVLLSGPIAPATNRGLAGSCAVYLSAAFLAHFAEATFIS